MTNITRNLLEVFSTWMSDWLWTVSWPHDMWKGKFTSLTWSWRANVNWPHDMRGHCFWLHCPLQLLRAHTMNRCVGDQKHTHEMKPSLFNLNYPIGQKNCIACPSTSKSPKLSWTWWELLHVDYNAIILMLSIEEPTNHWKQHYYKMWS